MNALWNLWINASIIKNLQSVFGAWPLYFIGITEGNEEDAVNPNINGRVAINIKVDKERKSGGEYSFEVEITVMITSTLINNDAYVHTRNEGLLESAIPNCIILYKIGTDDTAEFTRIIWDSILKPLQAPGIGPNARLSQTVYELHYEGTYST